MALNKSKTNKNQIFLVFYKVICKNKIRSKFIKAFKNKVIKEGLLNELNLNKPQKANKLL